MSKHFSNGSFGPHEDRPEIEELRSTLPDAEESGRMARLAGGFADPGRIRLLRALSWGDVCVGDLALALEVSQSSISHQLRLLHSLGIVTSVRRGRHIYYSIAWSGTEWMLDYLENPTAVGEYTMEDA
jgi:ArsR family transcriptional regulator, lead/cadmium/zinc/bismuth-responsive transcriptional repressor